MQASSSTLSPPHPSSTRTGTFPNRGNSNGNPLSGPSSFPHQRVERPLHQDRSHQQHRDLQGRLLRPLPLQFDLPPQQRLNNTICACVKVVLPPPPPPQPPPPTATPSIPTTAPKTSDTEQPNTSSSSPSSSTLSPHRNHANVTQTTNLHSLPRRLGLHSSSSLPLEEYSDEGEEDLQPYGIGITVFRILDPEKG